MNQWLMTRSEKCWLCLELLANEEFGSGRFVVQSRQSSDVQQEVPLARGVFPKTEKRLFMKCN